jgi:hypothetical protein
MMNSAESYNAAIQLHNHEFGTFNGKNNAFVIVQSILIAAFVTLLVYKTSFPLAFDIVAIFIIMVGATYCFVHHRAGQSAAIAAFTFFGQYTHTHNTNWWSQLNCERCLLERLPLPSAWLLTPSLFLFWWLFILIYIVVNYSQGYIHPTQVMYHQSPLWLFILLGTFAFLGIGIAFGIISVSMQRWWRRQF